MQDFTKLRVWAESHALALGVIHALSPARTRRIPGLRAQAIRAAMSVPANIAEGCGKKSPHELARYADIACASLSELQAHLCLAHDAGVLGSDRYAELTRAAERSRRMLVVLARTVRVRAGLPTQAERADTDDG